jgi:hypothetical protein
MAKRETKKVDRIKVIANGNQAPYGIGEIISTHNPSRAGLHRAIKECKTYYNRPQICVPLSCEDLVRDIPSTISVSGLLWSWYRGKEDGKEN